MSKKEVVKIIIDKINTEKEKLSALKEKRISLVEKEDKEKAKELARLDKEIEDSVILLNKYRSKKFTLDLVQGIGAGLAAVTIFGAIVGTTFGVGLILSLTLASVGTALVGAAGVIEIPRRKLRKKDARESLKWHSLLNDKSTLKENYSEEVDKLANEIFRKEMEIKDLEKELNEYKNIVNYRKEIKNKEKEIEQKYLSTAEENTL